MNCNKCFGPMKEYLGLNERDWYCDSKDCGKEDKEKTEKIVPRFVTLGYDIDPDAIRKIREEWIKSMGYPPGSYYDTFAAVKDNLQEFYDNERNMHHGGDDRFDALNYMFGSKGDKNERE